MTDESDIEKLVKRIQDYDNGVHEALKHPLKTARYWNRDDSLMRRIGRLNGYTAYAVTAASIGALTYQLIRTFS